jgi:hypothetical protein
MMVSFKLIAGRELTMSTKRLVILLTCLLGSVVQARSSPITALSDAILHDDTTLLNPSAIVAQVIISSQTDFTLQAQVLGTGTASAFHTLSSGAFSFSKSVTAPPDIVESFSIASTPVTLTIPPMGALVVSTDTEAKAMVSAPDLLANDSLDALVREIRTVQYTNTSLSPITITHGVTASYTLSLSGTNPPLIIGAAGITSGSNPVFSDELTSDGTRAVPLDFPPPPITLGPLQTTVQEFDGSVEARAASTPEPSTMSVSLIFLLSIIIYCPHHNRVRLGPRSTPGLP